MTNRRRTNRWSRAPTLWITIALPLVALAAASVSVTRQWHQNDLDHRLIQAIQRRQTTLAISLLNRGASANAQDVPYKPLTVGKLVSDVRAWLRGTKPPGEAHLSALMLASVVNIDTRARLFTMRRDMPLMHALPSHGADPNPSSGPYDGTALDMQIWVGDAEAVKLMLDHGAQPNGKMNASPLFSAVLADRVDIARLLLEHGADVLARTTMMDRSWATCMPVGTTLVHHAASKSRRNSVQMLDLLLSYRADVNVQDADGRTPLMWASVEPGPDIVPRLLRHGANPSFRDRYGKTSLHYVRSWPDSPNKRAVARLLRAADAAKDTRH